MAKGWGGEGVPPSVWTEDPLRPPAGGPCCQGDLNPATSCSCSSPSRSLSFLRVARPHCSSSSSRTGGTQTRQTAWAWPTSPATSPMCRGCPSMPPPCTPPLPWLPSTAWMMMAQARNRYLGGKVGVSRPSPTASQAPLASCFLTMFLYEVLTTVLVGGILWSYLIFTTDIP